MFEACLAESVCCFTKVQVDLAIIAFKGGARTIAREHTIVLHTVDSNTGFATHSVWTVCFD